MALTDENGGNMVMPVSPMGGGMGGGLFGGDLSIIILFFLFMMLGWGGNGFGGGFGGGDLYPWMNNSQNINNGFRDQMLATQLTGIQNTVTSGQFSDLERSFAAQTANTAGQTAIQAQLAQCCCDNRQATSDLRYTVGTEACATRTANAENTTALLTAFNTGIQSIKDQLCQDKIDAKNDVISQLRSELLYARGQASQDVQTAAIQAGQRVLANEIEQYVAPRAIPAYMVQNPNCCGQVYGCGV